MFQLQTQLNLTELNTLNLPCVASSFISMSNTQDLLNVFDKFSLTSQNCFVLGGGSNVILPSKLERFILTFETKVAKDATVINARDQDTILIEVEAGVNWDDFVEYSVQQAFSGLENLSLIPGSVGAAPIQNIGAYGVEVADVIEGVNVFNVHTKQIEFFSAGECQFAYRDSLFKRNPGQFIITSVCFRLSKKPNFKLEYGELSELKNNNKLTTALVRKTVIAARQAKLPDPKYLPNAGSFFKNPIVSAEQLNKLQQSYPAIVNYPQGSQNYKLAAAWLIDQAGWKGFRNETVGVHDKQALVIINHNHGTQEDILSLAKSIQDSVFKKFEVNLEIEPVVI